MVRPRKQVWGITVGLGVLGVVAWGGSRPQAVAMPVLRGISVPLPHSRGGGRIVTADALATVPQAPDYNAQALSRIERRWAQKDGATVWWMPFVLRAVDFHELYPRQDSGFRKGSGN